MSGLRPHQSKLNRIVKDFINGSPIRDVLTYAGPGAGKSLFGPIVSQIIQDDHTKLIIVTPRMSLCKQGESDFQSPIFDVKGKTIRLADNSSLDPFRGTNGAITTFQSIASRPDIWIPLTKEYKTILVLDEMDYLTDDSSWAQPIKDMWNNSIFRVAMTGSANRGDSQKIFPFTYDGNKLDFSETETRKWIIYDSVQSLKDGNIVPFDTYLIGGSGSYVDTSGIQRNFQQFSGKRDQLLTSFYTDYAYHVFDVALKHWEEYKKSHPFSKFLVISNDIKIAQEYTGWFKKRGYKFDIATSDDQPKARSTIDRLKTPNIMPDSLEGAISVSMIFRGLNVPEATHLVYLTDVRSLSYIQQSFGRIQRLYKNKDKGFVFAPDDIRLKKVIKDLNMGTIYNADGQKKDPTQKRDSPENDRKPIGIQALSSQAHIPDDIQFIPFEQEVKPATQSEIEKELRNEINNILNRYIGRQNPGNRKTKERIVWLRIKQIVNKGRDESGSLARKKLCEMTISELNKVLHHVKQYA